MTLLPLQMVSVESSVIIGFAFTLIVTSSVSLHPLASVATKVYVVVVTGLAKVLSQVAQEMVPEGAHR